MYDLLERYLLIKHILTEICATQSSLISVELYLLAEFISPLHVIFPLSDLRPLARFLPGNPVN